MTGMPRFGRRGPAPKVAGLATDFRVWADPDPDRADLHFETKRKDADYVVSGTWKVSDGRPTLVSLTVRSSDTEPAQSLEELGKPRPRPPKHISGKILSSVSVADLERETRDAIANRASHEGDLERFLREHPEAPAPFAPPGIARTLIAELKKAPLKPGPGGYPEDLYRWVAYTYLELMSNKNDARRVNVLIAQQARERFNRTVTTQQARDWVYRARDHGYLSRGRQGMPGATPGPKLQQPPAPSAKADRRGTGGKTGRRPIDG